VTEPNTRERILRAAAALFRQKGFNGTSMQDLAAAVGITKSSLYHHFPSKQALLSEILELTVERVTPAVRAVAEADLPAADRLRRAVALHLVELVRDLDNQACFIEEGRYLTPAHMEVFVAKRDRYEAYFRHILEDGIRTGEFVEHDVRLAVLAILGMCNWVVRWYRPDGDRSPDEIAEEFAGLAVRSVLAAEPRPLTATGGERERRA
jgi:AcrR family transcriptional regulator